MRLVGIHTEIPSLHTRSGGAFVGTLLVFGMGGPLGRRREVIIGSLLYLIGSAITISAPHAAAAAYVATGRFVYGLGIAFSMHAAPVYISGTSAPPARVCPHRHP